MRESTKGLWLANVGAVVESELMAGLLEFSEGHLVLSMHYKREPLVSRLVIDYDDGEGNVLQRHVRFNKVANEVETFDL